MEHKIGEIFEYNGEWYQCVKGDPIIGVDGIINYCEGCDISVSECDNFNCTDDERSDKELVIFKKLEKVGEPFTIVGKLHQHYKVFDIDNVYGDVFWCVHNYKAKILTIEIKQNKEEDMEETSLPKEDNPLTRVVYAYVNGKISDKELIRSIKEMSDEYPYNKNNLKPFSLELAKQGKPVCTKDGRKARIICFDRNDLYPIVALIECEDGKEIIGAYSKEGQTEIYEIKGTDLMMLPEKKEGWVNIYKGNNGISERVCGDIVSNTKEEATQYAQNDDNYITTVKIEWEK